MAGQIRPNKKGMKILYAIMKTPKDQQQNRKTKAPAKVRYGWSVDTITAQ